MNNMMAAGWEYIPCQDCNIENISTQTKQANHNHQHTHQHRKLQSKSILVKVVIITTEMFHHFH